MLFLWNTKLVVAGRFLVNMSEKYLTKQGQ